MTPRLLAVGFAATTIASPLFAQQNIDRTEPWQQPGCPPRCEHPKPLYPPYPVAPSPADKLRGFLRPEIEQGLVTVLGTDAILIVRIRGLVFPSGSAVVPAEFNPLLDRIGRALGEERGPVQVIGYTDKQPIRSVQFPSNFQLSAARAKAAAAIIGKTIGDASRIKTEGRGDADPIGNNATPEGREENRRIEVVLIREG